MARRRARGGRQLRSALRPSVLLLGLALVGLAVPFVASGFQTLEVAYALIFERIDRLAGALLVTTYGAYLALTFR